MADEDEQLAGWGGPAPAPDFVDRVLARVDERPAKRRRWALVFASGAIVGGLAVAVVGGQLATKPRGFERATHVQVPGVADVVGEAGSELRWASGSDGTTAVEVVRGVAWVRTHAAFVVLADGDPIDLGDPCVRVEVVRGFLSIDVLEDTVACERVQEAIERAEPSRVGSR